MLPSVAMELLAQQKTVISAALTPLILFVALAAEAQTPAAVPAEDSSPASWLESAYATTNILDRESEAVRLRAHVKLPAGRDKGAEGELTFTWVAWVANNRWNNRWLLETKWAGSSNRTLKTNERIWWTGSTLQRINDALWPEVLRFSGYLHDVVATARFTVKFSPVQRKLVGGMPADCLSHFEEAFKDTPKLKIQPNTKEVCLDPSSHLPLRVETTSREYDFTPGQYLTFGSRRFPKHILFSESGGEPLEMNVDSLEALSSVPPGTFDPPERAHSLPSCYLEEPPHLIRFSGAVSPDVYVMIIVVEPDASVKSVEAFDDQGADISQKPEVQALRNSSFYPASCKDGEVEGEFVYRRPPQVKPDR